MKIPCFLISRNLFTPLKGMVEWCHKANLEPIIVDNDSTYPPLLEYYSQEPCEIVKLGYNGGHHSPWNSGLIHSRVTDYFIVADPDFDLSEIPHNAIDKLMEGFNRFTHTAKVGFAIAIDDIPEAFPLKQQVLQWETGFWSSPMGDDFFNAPIDTTFALYSKKRVIGPTISGVRVGGPYTAKHVPFYLTPETMNDEWLYYFDESNKSISTMSRYLEPMIEEYRNSKTK